MSSEFDIAAKTRIQISCFLSNVQTESKINDNATLEYVKAVYGVKNAWQAIYCITFEFDSTTAEQVLTKHILQAAA